MATISEEQINKFLEELSKLSREHKVVIGGCGCCGSPFLMPMSNDGKYSVSPEDKGYGDNLIWEPIDNES